ncbi:MAG: c-type cytochrome [Dokdonella sp.]
MNTTSWLPVALLGAALSGSGSGTGKSDPAHVPLSPRATSANANAVAVPPAHSPGPAVEPANPIASFTPPPDADMPGGPEGEVIRQGRDIFVDTPNHAKAYVGNGLSCSNCHIDAGRLANSSPLWGAYGMYPQYRKKNGHVNTFGERVQGCFRYSMNGTAPPLDSAEMVALETYAWWLSKGAPLGVKLKGAGYPMQGVQPPQPADYRRGEKVYTAQCALCHGADGQGQQVAGRNVFPPLWGAQSFNWGAGMHELDKAAAFIKANMPFSRGGTLSDQDAVDVAKYMNSHERPQDPRYTGEVAATRAKFHDTPMSLYGTEINGHMLGTPSSPAKAQEK